MEKKIVPCYEVDCVVRFWELARLMDTDPEDLFYQLFPTEDYDNYEDGTYKLIDCYEKLTCGFDELRERWADVAFYIEDLGYRFYDTVLMVF